MLFNCECQVRFVFVAIQSFMCVSYAVVSYDVITPHGIIWYQVVLHCMIWNHTVPYHMVSYHILWDDIIWYDSICDTSEHFIGHKYKKYLSVILYCDCQEISVEGRDVCEMVQQCTKFAYVPIPIKTVIWLRWQGKLREHVLEFFCLTSLNHCRLILSSSMPKSFETWPNTPTVARSGENPASILSTTCFLVLASPVPGDLRLQPIAKKQSQRKATQLLLA